MNELWAAVIGVGGTLLGGFLGSWVTVRIARQTHEMTSRDNQLRERQTAFCEALNALLAYRSREIKRAMDARSQDQTIDDVPSVSDARDARSSCRYHLVVLRVLMPDEDVPRRYAELIDRAHEISTLNEKDGIQLAAQVKREVEVLAHDFGTQLRLATATSPRFTMTVRQPGMRD